MAGSMKYFQYQAGNGNTYAIWMDESNGEHVENADVTGADSDLVALPRNIKPRFAMYRSADGRYNRKIYVSSRTKTIDQLPDTLSITPEGGGTAVVLALAYFQGERVVRLVRGTDTGLNDGDET